MRLMLLFTAAAYSMPDDMWLQRNSTMLAKTVLWKAENVNTERLCQMTCADIEQCTAISYSYPICYLLADQIDGITCRFPLKVLTKTIGGVDRQNKTAEFGPDRCVTLYPDEDVMGQKGICPRISRDGKMFIIRAVNEAGARVTFDNEQGNILEFDGNRQMWKISFESAGFQEWLVAVSCASSTDACPCDLLPMMDNNRFDIIGGVYADTKGQVACANQKHELTYWSGKFQDSHEAGFVSADIAAKMKITCNAGIWLLTYEDNRDGWHVTNATCAPPPSPKREKITAELGDDPCAPSYFPEDTQLNGDGQTSICPQNSFNMVIRGVYEDGTRVTFDNNRGNVLTFDSARNMWKFFYKPTNFERWLIAVSCVLADDSGDCGCKPLPKIDASWGFPNGVEAQVSKTGMCADPSHDVMYWGGKFAADDEPTIISSTIAAKYQGSCRAGIWVFTELENGDNWEATNVTCWSKETAST